MEKQYSVSVVLEEWNYDEDRGKWHGPIVAVRHSKHCCDTFKEANRVCAVLSAAASKELVEMTYSGGEA